MRRAHSQSGFTLVEVLIASSLMIIVLSATLGAFENFTTTTNRTFRFNDQQDQIRATLDQIVRQVRNLANPTTGASTATPTTIAYASSDRFVFQTSDPSKQWVSYCLDSSTAGREKIYYQTSNINSLTPDIVASGSMVGPQCPAQSSNWLTQTQVADYVTNNAATPRPLFTYYDRTGLIGTVPVPLASTSTIVKVATAVYLRIDPNHPPAETELASTAWMRNQNQPPTSRFTATLSGTTYTFNGGDSSDPEQRTLEYDWYTAPASVTLTMPSTSALPNCGNAKPDFTGANMSGWGCLGTTVVVSKPFTTSKYVFLRVTDPGGLESISAFPTTGGCPKAVSSTRSENSCGAVP